LNKALGQTAALRFLSLLHRENTDYVTISNEIYKDQTIDEVYERASQVWQNKE